MQALHSCVGVIKLTKMSIMHSCSCAPETQKDRMLLYTIAKHFPIVLPSIFLGYVQNISCGACHLFRDPLSPSIHYTTGAKLTDLFESAYLSVQKESVSIY